MLSGRGPPTSSDQEPAGTVATLLSKAEEGEAQAQFELGYLHEEGWEVDSDYLEAAWWYLQAAEQGHAKAQRNLAHMYADGRGAPRDKARAVAWNRKAAERGDAWAQFRLGWSYLAGQGVPRDPAEGNRWIEKAANQGLPEAQWRWGQKHLLGDNLPQDDAEAVRWYRMAADQGHPEALSSMSWVHARGRGVAQSDKEAYIFSCLERWRDPPGDVAKHKELAGRLSPEIRADADRIVEERRRRIQENIPAREWIQQEWRKKGSGSKLVRVHLSPEDLARRRRMAADLGDPDAADALATEYALGLRGADVDPVKSLEWTQAAARDGSAQAQLRLAAKLAEGDGPAQDESEAVHQLRAAATQEVKQAPRRFRRTDYMPSAVRARMKLAECYFQGTGIDANVEEAVRWYRRAAESGYPQAQLDVAERFAEGRLAPRDAAEASRWWKEAAGHNPSIRAILHLMHQQDEGERDDVEAIQWWRGALTNGDANAQFLVAVMYEKGISRPEDPAEARHLYELAAEQGHAGAQNNLGELMLRNFRMEGNKLKAAALFAEAARQGYPPALMNLSRMMRSGQVGSKDDAEALRLLRLAVDQDYAPAQAALSDRYGRGIGVSRNPEESFRLLLSAAKQGYPAAQLKLAKAYGSNGPTQELGISPDNQEAYVWSCLAVGHASNSFQINETDVEWHSKYLAPDALETANQRVAELSRGVEIACSPATRLMNLSSLPK